MSEFYTYLHCKPDGDPFYVGKGCNNTGHSRRSHTFGTGRNNLHKAVVAEHERKEIGVFVFPCESEEQALQDELQQIAQLRSEGYELTNITKGGRGILGYTHSPETKAKLVAANIGNKYGVGNKNRLGIPHSKEARKKLSTARAGRTPMLGKKQSPAARAKISASLVGNKRAAWHKGKPWSPARRAAENKRKELKCKA